MPSICGQDCCGQCPRREECGGCRETGGRPFGGRCVAADLIREKGLEGFREETQALIREINALSLPQLQVEELHLLWGSLVNLAYPLPSGRRVQFLRDQDIYWGTQLPRGDGLCYGLAADRQQLLVCQYGPGGGDPRLLLYKRR